MKPLIVLLVVFVASLIFTKLFQNRADYHFAGKLALAVMLVFTATGHFVYTRGMMMMLPDFITYKESIIYLTGILEIVAAAGIFFPPLQNLCGSLLILFFVLLLPANIFAVTHGVDYQSATYGPINLSYLWFRVPFQLMLIIWTYFFVVK